MKNNSESYKGPIKKYLPIAWDRKQPMTDVILSIRLGHFEISFKNIKLSFSNYLSLQALEVHKYEDIENTLNKLGMSCAKLRSA